MAKLAMAEAQQGLSKGGAFPPLDAIFNWPGGNISFTSHNPPTLSAPLGHDVSEHFFYFKNFSYHQKR